MQGLFGHLRGRSTEETKRWLLSLARIPAIRARMRSRCRNTCAAHRRRAAWIRLGQLPHYGPKFRLYSVSVLSKLSVYQPPGKPGKPVNRQESRWIFSGVLEPASAQPWQLPALVVARIADFHGIFTTSIADSSQEDHRPQSCSGAIELSVRHWKHVKCCSDQGRLGIQRRPCREQGPRWYRRGRAKAPPRPRTARQ